jgi:hypothetical protein
MYGGLRGKQTPQCGPLTTKVPVFFTFPQFYFGLGEDVNQAPNSGPSESNPVSYPETTGSHIHISAYHPLNNEHEYHTQHTN